MRKLIIILLLSTSYISFAQERWTLEACIDYGVENSYLRNRQQLRNRITEEDRKEAIGAFLPSIQASTDGYFNFGRGLSSETNTYVNINSFSNSYSVYAAVTLFDGLANYHRLKMEKFNVASGRHELQRLTDMLAYDIMEAFFSVQYAMQLVELAVEQHAESVENVRQTTRMTEVGLKSFPDLAEMEAKEAADAYFLTKQKNYLNTCIIRLKEIMNFPIDRDLLIEEFIIDEVEQHDGRTSLDIYMNSLLMNPSVLAAESNLEAMRMAERAAKGFYSPTVALTAGLSTNYAKYTGSENASFRSQLDNKLGEYVGFQLNFPIFGQFQRTTAIKRSKYNLMIAQTESEETKRLLYSEIEQAVSDMNGQGDQYRQAVKQTRAMELAHNANQRKYEEGLLSALELHTSSNRVMEARIEEANARLIYYLKYRLVGYYKGEIPLVND